MTHGVNLCYKNKKAAFVGAALKVISFF